MGIIARALEQSPPQSAAQLARGARFRFSKQCLELGPGVFDERFDPFPQRVRLCAVSEVRFSIRRCDFMMAVTGLVHAKGVGFRFHARMHA
jgi:hypothetical protein